MELSTKTKQEDISHRWRKRSVGTRRAKERNELPPLETITTWEEKESLSCVNTLKKLEKNSVPRE